MLNSAMRNKISPREMFYILFISRIVVSLTSVHSVSTTEIDSQALISYVLAMIFTVVLCLPSLMCLQKGKNPIEIKWMSKLYFAYFIFVAAVNISRFSYFASTSLNPETQGWVFALIICACAFYAVTLGIEAISRFSAFCFVLLLLAIFSVLLSNVSAFNDINLYPVITSGKTEMIKNALVFSANTSEIAMFLAICPNVKGKCSRSYIRFICLSFLTVFILLYFALGVMGKSTSLRNYPFYSFFQISKFVGYERLDVLHISFWIMGVFVKSVAALYCACSCLCRSRNVKFAFVSGAITFVLSTIMLGIGNGMGVNYKTTCLLFFAFCVLFPILSLFYKKDNYGDELVKNF